jgi:two-component system, sensor histidine kinase LadS
VAHAQHKITLSESERHRALSNDIRVFHDTKARLNQDEALRVFQADEADAGGPTTSNASRTQGYVGGAFWLYMPLYNPHETPLLRWLEVGTPRLFTVSFFEPTPEGWRESRSGSDVPLTLRPVDAAELVFPVELAPHEQKAFLIRIQTGTSVNFDVALWTPEAFRQKSGKHHLALMGIVGGLFLGSLLSFLVWVFLREPVYGWLGLLLLGVGSLDLVRENLIMAYLWPTDRLFPREALVFVASLVVFSMSRVLVLGLELRARGPRCAKALDFVSVAGVALALLAFVDYALGIRWLSLLALLLMVSTPLLAFWTYRNGYRMGGVFGLAFGLATVLEGLRQMANQGFLPWTFPMNFSMGAFLLATPLIFFGLFERTRSLRSALAITEAKTQLLARISHELRSPLSTIIGFSRLIRGASRPACIPEHAHEIEQNGRHLLRLIDELLDDSRLTAGHLSLACTPTPLEPWLQSLCRAAEVKAHTSGNRFCLHCEGKIAQTLSIDPVRLRQVLENLLSNAFRHTVNSEVRLICRVRDAPEGALLYFGVADTGEGMDAADLKHIFEPFVRLPSTHSLREGVLPGFGLGLTIATELLELMDSRLAVSSTLGKGSLFSFELTCKKAGPTPFAQAIETPNPNPEPRLHAPEAMWLDTLALFVQRGEISRIEAWSTALRLQHPECFEYAEAVSLACARLDFQRLAELATKKVDE